MQAWAVNTYEFDFAPRVVFMVDVIQSRRSGWCILPLKKIRSDP